MKVTSRKIKQKYDTETGEITVEDTEETTTFPTEPAFVKMYLDDIVRLNGLPLRTSDVLHALVLRLDYEGRITVTARWKREVAQRLNTTEQVIKNQIQGLKKKGIIQPIGRGEFLMDPNLFAKGSWSDIRRLREQFLKLTIKYNSDGSRVMKSTLSKKNRVIAKALMSK